MQHAFGQCRGLLLALAVLAGCEIRDVPPEQATSDGATPAVAAGAHGGVAFVEGYDGGFQLAREQRKPMLIFFTASWCKYCRQMEQESLSQETVVDLSRRFVCVLVDADADPNVCRDFDVRGFPTIQFVSADGVRLNRLVGKQPPQQLVAQMRTALEALARKPASTLTQRR